MKDRRTAPDVPVEKDERLASVSDTDILLNFAEAPRALGPFVTKIQAHDGDGWDDLSEALFSEMVYGTFTYKYGLPTPGGWFRRLRP